MAVKIAVFETLSVVWSDFSGFFCFHILWRSTEPDLRWHWPSLYFILGTILWASISWKTNLSATIEADWLECSLFFWWWNIRSVIFVICYPLIVNSLFIQHCQKENFCLGMEKTVCEKDWGAPDPISGEAIARVSNLLSSGRLHR